MSTATLSQRRASALASANSQSTIQQAIDNGLFADSPGLQQALQSKTPQELAASQRQSTFAPVESNYLENILSGTPSRTGSATRMPLSQSILSSNSRQRPNGDDLLLLDDDDNESGLTSSANYMSPYTYGETYVTPSFVPGSGSKKMSLGKKLFPVSSTADKLQNTVNRIPRYVYVLAAIVLLAGLWLVLWRHMIVQFTFGRRKGQAAKCNGKRGTTGILQFGGAKELEHSPDWKFVLGQGVPTLLPHQHDAIVAVGVQAAVQSPMIDAAAMPTVVTAPVVGVVSSETSATVNETVTIPNSSPKTATAHLLETVGIRGFN